MTYRQTKPIRRTFTYRWCGTTETDFLCPHCLAILNAPTCVHCTRKADRQRERLQQFLKQRREVEL